jgi:hypothetical protein
VIKGALEAAGIVAAIIYAVVAYQQWQETITATNFSARQTELSRKGLNETIKNFRSGERAWIGVTNVTVNGEETTYPSVISYYVSIMNVGHSPGLAVTDYGYQTVEQGRNFRLPSHNVTVDPLHSSATMFPNVPHIGAGRHFLTPDEIAAVNGRTSFFYAYGTVSYKDIFSHPHWSHYCYRFDTKGGNQPFHVCDTYNDTDDYPEGQR